MLIVQENITATVKMSAPEIHSPYKPDKKPHRFYRCNELDVEYRSQRNPYAEKLMSL